MLLTEEQTKQYLNNMIEHYEGQEKTAIGNFSWQRTEAEYRKKTYKDIKIALFGEDVDDGDTGTKNTQAWFH